MNSRPKQRIKKSKLRLLHQYYSYTGFYSFVKTSLVKALLPISIFIIALWLINKFFIDFNDLFTSISTFNPLIILAVFFASESLLGLIPPEIFIAWAGNTEMPVFSLTILAVLSYVGGIISFFIGKTISNMPSVYNYLEVKMEKHVKMIRKWGGFLIVVGALLPIPFSITSIAAGLIHYKFKNYLLFGLFRFVRFYLYALVIFNVL
ncbi:MAG: short-chain dehydrogenase [Flavobacteriaceae bacterium]|jgi:membrane protein YqaA with SNARE-associated domain|nr:short-chain dehydrogenase [Flavobacteriaceae bacterium]MBT3919113.1 short-chain dehydrogenase [Flavobacteriaceae bacterium]MBT6705087.1 short-chain dehydrogenase [Flavobacteriaceae bacterium]|tara:strand:- start:1172 stop:1789 length:618 start_codon:yes stop_codon:yes gene_type:complete